MVRFFLLLLFTSFVSLVHAQHSPAEQATLPEKQISFAREKKPHAYYVRQAELWWAQVQQDQSSETNWFNYYRACRNAQGTADWKEDFVNESPALRLGADIVPLMKAAIPDTFTYYFVAGSTGGVASDGELLLKAYRLNPDFEGIHSTVVTYATTTRNAQLRREVNQHWYKRNELSPNLLTYAYNVLQSLAPGAVLLTEHDNDTFPLWMLQDVKQLRPDVTVINIDFLLDADFRTPTFHDLHIIPLELGAVHVNDYAHNWEKVVHHLVASYQIPRPLYLAMSMSPIRYVGLNTQLYPTGLAWRYSHTPIPTQALNQSLLAQKFFVDYLSQSFTYDISQQFVAELNLNYLPMLQQCARTYRQAKNWPQLAKVNQLAAHVLAASPNARLQTKYAGSFPPSKQPQRR